MNLSQFNLSDKRDQDDSLDKKKIVKLVKDLAKQACIDPSGVIVRDVGALVLMGLITSCLDIRVYVPEAGFEVLKSKFKGSETQVTYGRAHKRAGESYEYLMFPHVSVEALDKKVRVWTEVGEGNIRHLTLDAAEQEIKQFGYSPDMELLQMALTTKRFRDAELLKDSDSL